MNIRLLLYLTLYFSMLPIWATIPTQTNPAPSSDMLSFNVHDIPVRDLLELLAELKNMNLIVSDEVRGKLTLRLDNVTWQQALNAILTMQNLGKKQQDSILLIAPLARIAHDTEQADQAQNLINELLAVHYAKAADLAKLIEDKNSGLLSERGSVAVDTRTNKLWIKDIPDRIKQIHAFVQGMDIPEQQILIAARIVSIDEDSITELGLKFGTVAMNTDNNATNSQNTDMPLTINDVGHFTFSLARLGSNTSLDLALSALAHDGHAEIISKPELVTANRQPAEIQSDQEIPYQESTSSGATNVAFKKAVLGLKVTPEIVPEHKIALQLTVNQDKISSLSVNGVPAINTQEIQTQILVTNGETIVLGGIFEESNLHTKEHTPILGAIPFIGRLFSNKETHQAHKELLLFITPKIMAS